MESNKRRRLQHQFLRTLRDSTTGLNELLAELTISNADLSRWLQSPKFRGEYEKTRHNLTKQRDLYLSAAARYAAIRLSEIGTAPVVTPAVVMALNSTIELCRELPVPKLKSAPSPTPKTATKTQGPPPVQFHSNADPDDVTAMLRDAEERLTQK